ncbi:MAG: PEP-CTERM sorting domain-containing protein [Acidobacteria bacterium]|nr:PEP-CTERM sorting domain-containing protein [Acidobacteriota bacterium]
MKRTLILLSALLFVAVAIAPADVLPPGYIPKWSQAPDMNLGTDYLSMHRANGPVVVDDFQSDGRIILGYKWWGSYLAGAGDPNLAPGAQRQLSFEVSKHPDVPADPNIPGSFSQPGQPYQFQVLNAWESFFGTTTGGERVYEYWALLPQPWTEIAGDIYWFDVAYNIGSNPNADWGWHESWQHNLDFAVTTNQVGAGGNPHTGTWKLVGDGQRDMAFEVLTAVPEPSSILLFGTVLGGAGWLARRKARQRG